MTATPEYVERRLLERGLPAAGTTGQVLGKTTDADYEVAWQDVVADIPDGSVTTVKIADDAVTPAKIEQGTAAQLLITNSTPDTAWVTVTGDVTISSAGATTIGSGAVTSAKIAIGAVGTLNIASNAVTTVKIADDNVTTAKIAQGTAGQILITNSTPDTAWVTVTGDVTISSAGVTSIAAGSVIEADLATSTGEVAGVWNSGTSNTGFTNVTGGNLSWRYLKIGKTVHLRAWFTAGTATAAGFVEFTLPASLTMQNARATFFNAANGTTVVSSFIPAASPTKVRLTNSTASANFTAGATLTNLNCNGTLEVT